MKTIETVFYNNHNLSIFITANDKKQATAEYFIDGIEVTDFSKTRSTFVALFNALFDDYCKCYDLIKWNY